MITAILTKDSNVINKSSLKLGASMKNFLYTTAIAIAVMSTAGFAAEGKKSLIADNAASVNKYGQLGLWNTHSAQTLGKGRLAFNIYGNHSGDKNFVKNVYQLDAAGNYLINPQVGSEFSKSTVNVSLAYGFTSFLDMSIMAPVYIDWIKGVYFNEAQTIGWQTGNQDEPSGGVGDAEVTLKFQFPPYAHRTFFEMAYYGSVSIPTGHQTNGRFIRNTYYLNKNDNDSAVYFFTSGKGKPDIDMKMLWTWDFREVADFFPVLFHFNYGITWTTQPKTEHAFNLNAGLEVRPVDFVSIFADFSAEPRLGSIQRDIAINPVDGSEIKRGLKHDPLRLSPGVKFLVPGGFNLSAGADISLANGYGVFVKQKGTVMDYVGNVETPRPGTSVVVETAVEPKYAFAGSIGWNGFVIAQDRDHDGIVDKSDLCPAEPEDRDGFMDTDGCPDFDNDNDSVADTLDKCPNTAGPVANGGCPIEDRDGDKIKDVDDLCPDVPGLPEFFGCPNPDRDGDRVLDSWVTEKGLAHRYTEIGSGIDKCPEEKGSLDNSGCPVNDKDGDGIVDKEDACPDLFGITQFAGCPNPDRDADGIADPWVTELGLTGRFAAMAKGYDKCPDQPETVNGLEDEDGCPDVKETPKAMEITRGAMVLRGVNFETGKAILTKDSYDNLDKVLASLKEYPEVKIEVSGHTDNVGSAEANKRLSYNRAKAVMNYFVSQGVAESRLRAIGMGMEAPVAENTTVDGRAMNRRVELKRYD